jgi:hypothetical protein
MARRARRLSVGASGVQTEEVTSGAATDGPQRTSAQRALVVPEKDSTPASGHAALGEKDEGEVHVLHDLRPAQQRA